MSNIITMPNNFTARGYQVPLYNCLTEGYKRGAVVWHRRAGKDKTFMGILGREVMKRVGTYDYILPYYTQARSVIWEGMDKEGFRMVEHIHPSLVERKDNQKMTLELKNGSIIRFLGSDNIDSIVGTNPVGIIFSEFSLHKIEAWNYLRPILLENGGWALFNGTPRGKNHLYDMVQKAKKDPNWFCEVLTIDDTGVMTKEQVDQEIADGMPKALAKQEFYCSFDAALTGAYYGEAMARMEADKRVTAVPWEPQLTVSTAWDLGIDDTLVIIMFQQVNRQVRIIDLIADNGQGLEYYTKKMHELPYSFEGHYLPHDVQVRELGTGDSRISTLRKLGLKNIRVVPRASVEDGINATRSLLGRTWIDDVKCDKLIEALKGYRAKYDPKAQVYGEPVHDWTSHYADSIRMLASAVRDRTAASQLPPVAEGADYNPFRVRELAERQSRMQGRAHSYGVGGVFNARDHDQDNGYAWR